MPLAAAELDLSSAAFVLHFPAEHISFTLIPLPTAANNSQVKPHQAPFGKLHFDFRVSGPDLMHSSNICITTDSSFPSTIPRWIFVIHQERRDETIEQVSVLASNVVSRQQIVLFLPLLIPEFWFFCSKGLRKQMLSQYF